MIRLLMWALPAMLVNVDRSTDIREAACIRPIPLVSCQNVSDTEEMV